MGKVAMKIKRRAESAPKKGNQHDGQKVELKTCEKPDYAEQLQHNQCAKNNEIEFFVFKHSGRLSQARKRAAVWPLLNPEPTERRMLLDEQQLVICAAIFSMREIAAHDKHSINSGA